MTRIDRASAVAVARQPYSNTSDIVTWVTEEQGRLTTLVKGALRRKSSFLGQYDIAYTCELLYYANRQGGLAIARECTPLSVRSSLRRDWRAFAVASFACTSAIHVMPDGHANRALFTLLNDTLDALCVGTAPHNVLPWFLLRLCACSGVTPELRRCATCGAPLATQTHVHFSPSKGGMICASCSTPVPDAETIGLDLAAILRRWAASDAQRTPARVQCNRGQWLVMQRILGMLIEYHLGIPPDGRKTTAGLLQTDL